MFITQDISASEFLALVEKYPDRHFDFIDGEIVEVSPKPLHGWIQALIARLLGNYLEGKSIGYVHTEVLHILQGMKFIPDVSVNVERAPEADYFGDPPLLAVEIRSDTQSREAQRRKAHEYIQRGTMLVWLIMPNEGVEVFRSGQDRVVLTIDDMLSGGSILPGFEVPVSDLFPG